jgi:3',5'-cyclic AMP phosphodiesterase CpdA
MRLIVHLSDIHFGRVGERLVIPLVQTVNRLQPDLVVVSGDLTQRARRHQFVAARSFLNQLPRPQIVVPGNHDVPLYNVFKRLARPLDNYRQFISADLEPFYADEEIAVLGVNTARALTFKGGRINRQQIRLIEEKFCSLDERVWKILVTHHPFDAPENHAETELVGRARLAMKTLAACGTDIFLAGHLHVSHVCQTAARYRLANHSALVIQAGTAVSTRGRGENNSFNLIYAERPFLTVEKLEWHAASSEFVRRTRQKFRQTANGNWESES